MDLHGQVWVPCTIAKGGSVRAIHNELEPVTQRQDDRFREQREQTKRQRSTRQPPKLDAISSVRSSRGISRLAAFKRSSRDFRPSPTDICTSGTPNPSASISAWRRNLAGGATCVSTI